MATTCNLTKFTAFTNEDDAIAMLERLRLTYKKGSGASAA